MIKVTSLPDKVDIDVNVDETLLEAALRSGVALRTRAEGGGNVRRAAFGC